MDFVLRDGSFPALPLIRIFFRSINASLRADGRGEAARTAGALRNLFDFVFPSVVLNPDVFAMALML